MKKPKHKLSYYILKGCKLRKKAKRGYFMAGGSCALGAAYEGLCGRTEIGFRLVRRALRKAFPCLIHPAPKATGLPEDTQLIYSIIIANDHRDWSRQRIARALKKARL